MAWRKRGCPGEEGQMSEDKRPFRTGHCGLLSARGLDDPRTERFLEILAEPEGEAAAGESVPGVRVGVGAGAGALAVCDGQ